MNIKRTYYYLFYKLYKSIEATSNPKFWSDWKAELVIDVLEIFICLSFLIYYTVFTGNQIDTGNGKFVVLLYFLFIALPNYFIFHHKNQWKDIVKEFDKSPKQNKKRKGFIVWIIIVLIILNLIFSYYLLFAKAEKNHTGPYSKEYIEQQKNKK